MIINFFLLNCKAIRFNGDCSCHDLNALLYYINYSYRLFEKNKYPMLIFSFYLPRGLL